MAPLTRCRAVEDNCANELMATYYAQRASAGLIITEASQISPLGVGYLYTPGIYTDAQIKGWEKVTTAVHEKGGVIYLQLWHVGRVSHSSFLNGQLPVAPSAVKIDGKHYTPEGMQPFETPRALEIHEIKALVKEYAQAASNAVEAGFDGVEIHGANGYLIDQFIKDGSNKRTDAYGGSIENRSRFLFEVLSAVCDTIGCVRTALRLSPSGTFNSMTDTNPTEAFQYICNKLNDFDLAYLHIIDALEADIKHGANVVELQVLRDAYKGVLITNGEYDKIRGNKAIENELADAVAYGTLYISNPDLPERFETDAPLATADPHTFYTHDEKGYTDYKTI